MKNTLADLNNILFEQLVRQAIDDEFDQIMVAGAMTKVLLEAAAGESKGYEVVSAEHKKHVADEEED